MVKGTSAEKQARVSEKKRLRNKPVRSHVKAAITKAENLIFSGEVEKAQGAVAAAISSLDRAADKKILHANNAARRKSRLMKKLNTALASSSAKAGPEKSE